jgi:hypothetical protein
VAKAGARKTIPDVLRGGAESVSAGEAGP